MTAIPRNVRTRKAIDALLNCSVIFGCVDRDGPRLVLNDLAAAYEIPLIDVATEIFSQTDKQPFDFGGRVVVARPGDYCLFCADQIDRELAKEEFAAETISEDDVYKNHGGKAPATTARARSPAASSTCGRPQSPVS